MKCRRQPPSCGQRPGLAPVHRQAGRQELPDALSPKGQGRDQPENIGQELRDAPRGRWCLERSPKEQGEGQREEDEPVCTSKEQWGWENHLSAARQVSKEGEEKPATRVPFGSAVFQASFGLFKTSPRGDWSILQMRNEKPGEWRRTCPGSPGAWEGEQGENAGVLIPLFQAQAHGRRGCGQTGPSGMTLSSGRVEPHG